MSTKGWRNLLIVVTSICLGIFTLLVFDSVGAIQERSPILTEKVVAGKKVWQTKNCINCHTILGNGAYFGPDLTKTTQKRAKEWLQTFLQEPGNTMPGTSMSVVKLTAQEADNMVDFLDWVSGIDTNDWPPDPVLASNSQQGDQTEGKRLFFQNGCSNCHEINGQGGGYGPDLSKVGADYNARWLKDFIKNPESVRANASMSPSDLSDEELSSLANYLSTLK